MRLKNDPGLVHLTTKVYIGRLATKKLVGRVFCAEEAHIYDELIEKIEQGKQFTMLIT